MIAEVNKECVILLGNIYFDFAKFSVKEESTISLNKIIKVLTDNPDLKLVINAHTDNVGSASSNLKLSHKHVSAAV